jgi:hypothetical protein
MTSVVNANTGSIPVLTTKIKIMQKAINIIGSFTVGLLLIAIITLTIGALWEAPNEGLLHNLCRYSTIAVVILGSILTVLLIHDELKR